MKPLVSIAAALGPVPYPFFEFRASQKELHHSGKSRPVEDLRAKLLQWKRH